MRRLMLSAWLVMAPGYVLWGAVGCEPKTTTVHRTEEVRESEPQQVSPGEEVLTPDR